MVDDDLQTSASCLAAAEKWERVFQATPFGDPAKRLAELNIEFFLQQAAELEEKGK